MMSQPAQQCSWSVMLLARPAIAFIVLILLVGCQPVMPEGPAPAAAPAVEGQPAVAESPVITTELTGTAAMTASTAVTPGATLTTSQPVTETASALAPVTPSGSPGAGDPALIEAGLAVYRQQYCGVCHTLSAAGTRGAFGPPHDGMGATAAARIADPSYTGSATTAAAYIMESLINPYIYLVPGYTATPHRMPPYSHLDPASLDALVAMLLAQ